MYFKDNLFELSGNVLSTGKWIPMHQNNLHKNECFLHLNLKM